MWSKWGKIRSAKVPAFGFYDSKLKINAKMDIFKLKVRNNNTFVKHYKISRINRWLMVQ
jgi:hypothetical protein